MVYKFYGDTNDSSRGTVKALAFVPESAYMIAHLPTQPVSTCSSRS